MAAVQVVLHWEHGIEWERSVTLWTRHQEKIAILETDGTVAAHEEARTDLKAERAVWGKSVVVEIKLESDAAGN